MKIIDSSHKSKLSEKVTVEMSLEEMSIITAIIGATIPCEVKSHIEKSGLRKKYVNEVNDVVALDLYENFYKYLVEKGVFRVI
mgnify:CR=1 FL=1